MKHIKLTYIIFIALFSIATIYFFSNTKGTLNKRNTSFAIESIDDISSIKILVDNQELLLKKEMQKWKVNNKYQVKGWNINNFLIAANRIDLLASVSNTEKDQVASLLKSDGIVVEFFKGKRRIRKYYVSKPAMNKSKTYMMMYKSSEPFIVRIPSFQGLVADLFVVDENYWRDKTVFDYPPQNIKNIIVEYPNNQLKSFKLINYNNGTFALQTTSNEKFIDDFDVSKVARYFTYFQGINFEKVIIDQNKNQLNSISENKPFLIIFVEDIYGIKNSLKVYRKPSEHELDEFGQKAMFDYNRAYGVLNDADELILIQYYIFDPLFKEIDYFR